ncbi:MAG: DUF2628 domain-containing protein [Bauldia sp.]
MAIYTVLVPREGAAAPDPLAAIFVKDGFSWPAFLVGVPWLIFRRLWFVLLGYVIVGAAVASVAAAVGSGFVVCAIILFQFPFALEANELRRWTLVRHGYRFAGIIEGRGLEEAEIRYFATGDASAATIEPPAASAPPSVPSVPPAPPAPPPRPPELGAIQPSAEAGDVVGLFPAPGAAS